MMTHIFAHEAMQAFAVLGIITPLRSNGKIREFQFRAKLINTSFLFN